MIKNQIRNLMRFNIDNLRGLIIYKLKKKLNIKPSKKETELYIFYGYLVKYNGFLVEETENYYLINFKNKESKLVKLRKRPSSDMDVFYQIYEVAEYLPVVQNYDKNFKNDSNFSLNIIDAGSNIGLTALFFSESFSKAKIVAVEPDNQNFNMMNYNLVNKENFDFVKVKGAVWSSNTKIKVINDFRDKSDWSFRVEESDDIGAIEAFTINYLAEVNGFDYIDILKIDIEGSEKQIFTSANANLDFLKKTKCIVIEIHDEFECREDIYLILKNYGFTYLNQGELTIGINRRLSNK
jgi:FkbM family methyltransferase